MKVYNHNTEYWEQYTTNKEFKLLSPVDIANTVQRAIEAFNNNSDDTIGIQRDTSLWYDILYVANVHYSRGGLFDYDVALAMVAQIC